MNPDVVLLLVAGVWVGAGPVVAPVASPPVRLSSSVMVPGVVPVMAAWKVAWFIGSFQTTWDVERGEQFGLKVFGQLVQAAG